MRKLLFSLMLLVTLFTTQVAMAQAPVATAEGAITALLNRIGGDGAAGKFEIVIDANLAENGKDVFVITAQNGKPCIKGNNQLSVATGINWYLNHYAHINLTWNNLTTDLSQVTLPPPASEEKHVCNTTYRYDFNTCTFSYSMAFWTWERWQKEIDWMALHGINAPLNLVGLDVVTRNFLKELGMSDSDIAAYIAGPGFIAWFAMNNLEGWGGTINSPTTGVNMSGNPEWWYTRQEQLCKNMLQRMRELGMQPVIPGFSGQIPNSLSNYSITGFSSGDVINGGTWAGGYTRPDILHPNSSSYATLAPIYYKHLEAIMGVSEFYSMDPFHEGGLPSAVTNATCYPPIMAALDTYHNAVEDATKTSYNVSTEDNQAKWIIQYWQNIPQSGAFSSMESYGDRFIGLDLFSDNIYAGNAAKWRDTGDNCYYKGRPYIYCMLHNFGGRSGLHGRLETTMNGYFEALAKNNNCQGIGATPEGTETNPILYDMLFELPWMDVNSHPTADEWLEDYAYSRYGIENETALSALKYLKNSVWNCEKNQQGTSEAVILARPNWTINNVSSWSTSAIYWDTHDVRLAADQLISVADLVTANGGASGIANYNYDAIDVIRQAMVDFAAELLPLINAARGNDTEYTRLYQLYLQLMLDLDTMLSYDENFKLERWTSLARNIAGEVTGTTDNDRNWLEWNARTQVTVWAKGDGDLHDYSNRCWAGLIKDFHYWRWKYFFENNGGAPSGGWFSGFEYPWTVDFNNVYNYAGDYSQIVIPTDMSATAKAAETFGKYFGRVKGETSKYIFPMGVETNATKSDAIPEVYRGQTVELPLEIGKEVTVSSVQIDLNGDGAISNTEALTADGMNVTIPADAAIGKTKAIVEFSDGTVITFNLAIIVDITANRTVTAATADANMGTVAIEGTNELTITNMEAVKITATANTGYNFKNWTDAQGNVVSNDNPYIYYGEGDASFTANFIEDKWGVVACNGTLSGDIASYAQFIHNLTFAYYNREAETILEATTAPTQIFNTIPQIIDVPQGASFTVEYDNGSNSGLQYCYFRAYIDLNADGDFDDEGELLKEVGTNGATNTAVCSNTMNVLLPYDAPLGITHMRLRFDGAWDNNNNPSGRGAKDASIRPVYEIVLNITDKTDKAAHVTVKTNSEEWGTVEVWTDETPDGSTGTEWDVSSNIPFYLRATKASEDTEFLGWYDHYGRLLTTELEYDMYAREDATYTARFRKFLEIDGWLVEYRTEPGTEIKYYSTTALANGVAPVGGKKYYIAAHTLSGGNYYNRYLYDNNGTLATSTTVPANCVWTCIENSDGTFSFQNESGKYLANNNSYHISIGTTAAKYTFEAPSHEGVTLKNAASYTGGKYMVTSSDGTAFNRNEGKRNDSWSSDYLFYEGIVPDNVILTNVRKSGKHDLVIPETVEILGEQCTITGFDNGLFANNKDLWSISLPATIETMSSNRVFKAAIPGKGANQSADASNYTVTDLGTTCGANEDWAISLTVEDNGNNFNQWGSALIATGSAPMNSTYKTGFQLYMQAGGGLVVKTDVDGDSYKLTNLAKNSSYRIDVVYTHSNTKLVVTATPLAAQASLALARRANATRAASSSLEITQDMSGFSTVSHAIPEGVNITNLEVTKGAVPDPFEGCTNLMEMNVDNGNTNYYVDGRTLYTTGGTDLHELVDEEKAEKLRALGELIDKTDALIEEVAVSINPTGKATEITLSATQGENYYLWCNNPHGDNTGKVSNMLDENAETFFHSNWSSLSNIHDYLQIDFGTAAGLDNFKIGGQQRHNATDDRPKFIEVYGSNDNNNWTPITTVDGLQNTNGSTWESNAITADTRYAHLKFVVKTYNNFEQTTVTRPYFHMAKFDLFKLTSTAEVAPLYKNLAGITNEETATVYDSLAEALYLYNNGGTADEMQAAYEALNPLYTALKTKKDKIFNGVYNINFNNVPVFVAYLEGNNDIAGANNGAYRLFDGAIAHDGATDGNTVPGYIDRHQSAIDAKAVADALFTIVPNSNATGYTISAQELYLEQTCVGWWGASAFSSDKEQAGVYLFEEIEDEVYKLKCATGGNIPYVNDWGCVFGNNESNKAYSTFTLTKVTEYTLNVPESGVTTLCLPFNVVLPTGVTAYDITKAGITRMGGADVYALSTVATEGQTLAKNTPVIIKATAGNYVLTITMSDEDAKGATDGSVLRSDFVKTTLDADADNYTFDGENFNLVTESAEVAAEVAANQCYMQVSDKGSVIYNSAAEYILTVDEDNPVLYKIEIKRANDGSKVLLYDEPNDEKVKIVTTEANKSYQAWYFMKGDNGIRIKPYNADGKVLTVESTGNGRDKAVIAPIANGKYQEWDIVKSTVANCTDYYYIKVNGTTNATFSHNGGFDVTYHMGIWSGGWNTDDTGSLFKFVPLTFDNDNSRFYQLQDVAEYLGDGPDVYTGTSVGLYNLDDYTAARDAASAIVTAGDETAAAECYAAYTTLREKYNNVSVNVASPDKIYYIKSVAAADLEWNYSTGKYVHTLRAATTREDSDKTYNHSHLVFDAFGDITPKSLAAFQFEAVEGGYKIKNLHTGLYVKSFAQNAEHMGAAEDAAVVKVSAYADGQVTLKIGDNKPMHAEKVDDVIVQWDAQPGNASLWTIDEVADITDLNYTITMPADGYTTLYLPYNVVLPAGVTAYTVAPENIRVNIDGSYGYELTEVATVGQKLAKGTAVIIKGTADTEYTFTATLDDAGAISPVASAMAGANIATTVNSDDVTKRYSVTVENGNLIFTAITAETIVAANSCWLETTVDTDKIGLPVVSSEVTDKAVYRIKGRLSNGTFRTLYTDGSNRRIRWTTDGRTDASTLFIAQKNEETGKFKFVSALANGIWGQDATLNEEGVELSLSEGKAKGAYMIVGEGARLFCIDADDLDFFSNVGTAGSTVNETVTTDFAFEEVANADVSFTLSMKSGSKWATLYLPFAVTVPDNLVAYFPYTPDLLQRVVSLRDLGDVIPAYTPVVIGRKDEVAAVSTSTADYKFAYTKENCTVSTDDLDQVLFGRLIEAAVNKSGMRHYVILTIGNNEAFYWISKEYDANKNYVGANGEYIKCSANKAYMVIAEGSGAASYSFSIEGTTGIDDVVVDGVEDEVIYDLQGRRIVEITSPGVYIINGKTVIVK